MLKITFVAFGSLSLSIGIIGIVIPGLPSTPFFLISAACYLRSSPNLYNWITNHHIFGKYIRIYHEHKAMTIRSKIISLIMMWFMIICTIITFIEDNIINAIIVIAGITGTILIIKIKTFKSNE